MDLLKFQKKDETNNELIRNLLSVNGVEGFFLEKILYQLIKIKMCPGMK